MDSNPRFLVRYPFSITDRKKEKPMSVKFSGPRTVFDPVLDENYTSGQSLFNPVEISLLTPEKRASRLTQVSLIWDVANAPPVTIFVFNAEPTNFGNAKATPALTFVERASIIGVLDFATTDYDQLNGLDIGTIVGPLAELSSADQRGWLTARINAAYTGDLEDKLKIAMQIERM